MNGLTFMVVEDSPTMRQLIGLALAPFANARVVEAVDGADALRQLASESIDFILTDINMPIMDGLKLISILRSTPSTRHLPVVIISTEGAEEDRLRGLSLGADAYITKPLDSRALLDTVEDVLRRQCGDFAQAP